MRADDEFLSAFSFADEASSLRLSADRRRPASPSPVRGPSASSPTLCSLVSDAPLYSSVYPFDFYGVGSTAAGSSSAPPALAAAAAATAGTAYSYGAWNAWKDRGAESCAAAEAAVYTAEKQRRVLKMEMDLAAEQRGRLEARMALRQQHSASRRSPDAVDGAAASVSRGSSAQGGTSSHVLCDEAERRMCELVSSREASAEVLAPPPCSPSPPSAHVQAAAAAATGPLFADDPAVAAAAEASETTAPPSPLKAKPAAFARSTEVKSYTAASPAEAVDCFARSSTASPSPSRAGPETEWSESPSASRAASERRSPRTAAAADATTTTAAAPASSSFAPKASTRVSAERPPSQPSPPATQSSPPQSSRARKSPSRSRAAASVEELQTRREPQKSLNAFLEEEEEEQRMYAAYQRKLARIQQALRTSHLRPSAAEGSASIEARLAYQQRRHIGTPSAYHPDDAIGGKGSAWPLQRPAEPHAVAATAASCSTDRRTLYATAGPLLRRAPSLESAAVVVTQVGGPACQLRWDFVHSGNVVVSPDGLVCRADAADAIALIEAEYADRLHDVLPRLIIPFYAIGSLGATRDTLIFAFRWISSSSFKSDGARPPALAFGFATRGFTGYGTETPAFLYLSSGTIAQGLPTLDNLDVEHRYGPPYRPGLELAARLDLRRGELEFFVESVSMGVAFRFCPARHPAPLYPVVVFSMEGDTAELLYSA